MSLGNNAVATPKLHQIDVTQSVNGIPIPIGYGTCRMPQNLLWYGDFTAGQPYQSGGKGLGKDANAYEYYAAVLSLLAQGPVSGINSIWGINGKLTPESTSENYVVPSGGGSYTVANSSIFAIDQGVGRTDAYNLTVNDYGSPGPTTLSGTQQTSMELVTSSPGKGQYTQSAGTYTFSPEDAGSTVVISYVYSLYTLTETEDYNVPDATPFEITVKYQTQFQSDRGVLYIETGLPLQSVGGSPGVGQYNPNGGNYMFNPGDATAAIAISYTWQQTDSNVDPSSTLAFTLISGTQGQEPWSYLLSKHPSAALGYSTLALNGTQKMDLGESAQTPNYNFECMMPFIFGAGIQDADLALIIQDFLTNPIYGAQFDGNIDASLMGTARNYWNSNGFFISPFINSADTAASIIEQWVNAGNVGWFWSENALKFVPYGDTTTVGNGFTYTPADGPVFDFDDDDFLASGNEDPVTIERSPWQDSYNVVKVQFQNRINDYNPDVVQEFDDYSISQFGFRQEAQQDFSFIKNQTAATFAANIRIKRLIYIHAKYSFKVSSVLYGALEPMDLVTLTEPGLGLNLTPCRVIEIEEDDKYSMTVTCEEFPWGTATATLYPKQATTPVNQIGIQTSPGNTSATVFETTPQHLNGGQNTLIIAAAGGSNWGGAKVYVSQDGENYTQLPGAIQGSNRIGVLTTVLPNTPDPDTTDTLSVNMSLSGAQLQSATSEEANAFATLCSITNPDGTVELISYQTATLVGTNLYHLTNLRRGVYGSKISSHAVGAVFTRLDANLFTYQYPAQYVGQPLYIKLLSFNVLQSGNQSLSDVSPITYTVPGTTLGTPAKGNFSISPSNPLSAQVTGSNAQITCGVFTASFNGLSVNCTSSAVITGLSQGQLYYVYYVDLAFAGGTITPIATQNQNDYLNKSGYYLINTIVTPGTSSIYRPSTYSDIGTTTTVEPADAYDLNPTSQASVTGFTEESGTGAITSYEGEIIYSGFASIIAGTTLNVVASAIVSITGSGSASGTIAVSFNNGTSYSTLASFSATTAKATYPISVPSGTNLANILVKITTTSTTTAHSSSANVNVDVNDINVQ